MRFSLRLLLLVALASPLGCMGKVLSQSVQAGSTVAIPLAGQGPDLFAGSTAQLGPVGFGGSAVDDPQRGQLVYQLETGSGLVNLTTRGTTVVTGHAGSGVGRGEAFFVNQIVSIVDIPDDAPHGTHPIRVLHEYTDPATGNVVTSELDYEGELSVLPHEVSVSTSTGPELVTGGPTPLENWLCGSGGCSFQSVPQVQAAVPDPAVRLTLDTAVWGVELEVTYPSGVIDVLDAYETPLGKVNDRATTWVTDDGSGTLTLSAAATQSSFDNLSVAFGLDDPQNAILDPANVSVSVVRAWDQDGNEITSSVNASVGQIF